MSWCIEMGDPVHGAGAAAEAAAWRCKLVRAADTARGGGGLTALAVGIEAGGMRPAPADPFRPIIRASLPGFERAAPADARGLAPVPDTLPGFRDGDGATAPDRQAALPGFEAVAVGGCPSWLLWAYSAVGGAALSPGRGAPWPLRLFVAALLHLGVSDRDGEWHTLRFPVAEVEGWLHPRGWGNRRRDWHRFPDALKAMRDLAYVPVPGLGRVLMIAPSVIPERPSDPLVEFVARIPAAAASGARLDWPRLSRYGCDTAALYRAYLSVSAALDRAAHRGAPPTRQIGAALIDASGRPRRRRGGRILRSTDPAALVSHPAARLAPRLTDRDAAVFVGYNPADRRRRGDARGALERLAADGVIDLQRCADGRFALYAPRQTADGGGAD